MILESKASSKHLHYPLLISAIDLPVTANEIPRSRGADVRACLPIFYRFWVKQPNWINLHYFVVEYS